METAAASTEAQITIEDGGLNPGGSRSRTASLYYTKLDGRLADGPVALGKQILTFSRNGELTMIGDNKAVSENRNLFFDEMIQYEIKGGDIYKEEPGEEETCIVLNGHVVQADFRCGYLWYISQYQIPNSSQVKTTI